VLKKGELNCSKKKKKGELKEKIQLTPIGPIGL
jgi:hypothetical protein